MLIHPIARTNTREREQMRITLWLVGTNADDAQGNFPFDSEESAASFANDNPGTKVYSVYADIDFSTIEEVN